MSALRDLEFDGAWKGARNAIPPCAMLPGSGGGADYMAGCCDALQAVKQCLRAAHQFVEFGHVQRKQSAARLAATHRCVPCLASQQGSLAKAFSSREAVDNLPPRLDLHLTLRASATRTGKRADVRTSATW